MTKPTPYPLFHPTSEKIFRKSCLPSRNSTQVGETTDTPGDPDGLVSSGEGRNRSNFELARHQDAGPVALSSVRSIRSGRLPPAYVDLVGNSRPELG